MLQVLVQVQAIGLLMEPAGETGRRDQLDLLLDDVAVPPFRQIAILHHPHGEDMAETDPAQRLRRQIYAAGAAQHDGQGVTPDILMQFGHNQAGGKLAGGCPGHGHLPDGILLFHIHLTTAHAIS
ncbi:hypothetical protein D3C80_963720 [compost metagenome]